jgi:hypothetical protein
MKILGYHISENSISNSDGEVQAKSPYIRFLTMPKQDTIRVLYNLKGSITNLLKMLNCNDAMIAKLLDTTRLTVNSYNFRYIPDKFFSIKKHNVFAYYSDMKQYLAIPNIETLSNTSRMARDIGELVYAILKFMHADPKSLNNPVKAFEESETYKLLDRKMRKIYLIGQQHLMEEVFHKTTGKILESLKDDAMDSTNKVC